MSRRRKKRNSKHSAGFETQSASSAAGYQQESDWEQRGARSGRGCQQDWQDDDAVMCAPRNDYPDWP